MYSQLIKNATVIDGTGKKSAVLDVAINGDEIVNIAPQISTGAHKIINGAGKYLAPGFIDVQNHSDSHWQIFDDPNLESLVTQGYTTILIGNSGSSLAPLISKQAIMSLQKWHNMNGISLNWQTFQEFVETMSARKFGCNMGSMIGYDTIRRGLIGDSTKIISSEELGVLINIADQALKEGAFGISTGLSYAHELNISDIELFELAKLCAKHKALLSIHLRNESDNIVHSVREIITIAEQSGANCKIAHLKIRGQENWHLISEVLDEIEIARHQGVNIHFDVYPYNSTWQPLYTYLPLWSVEGGRKEMLERLKDSTNRNKILQALNNSQLDLKSFIIASTTMKMHVTGKRLSEIAKELNTSSEEAFLQIIEHGGSEILIFDESMNEDNVNAFSMHALGLIATNGSGYNIQHDGKLVHPRCFGTSTKFLKSVLANKQISIEEAIRKLTQAPAEKIGLTDRGVIAIGMKADLVMFSDDITDKATLKNPFQYSSGINQVWINGQTVIEQGMLVQQTGELQGQFLTRD